MHFLWQWLTPCYALADGRLGDSGSPGKFSGANAKLGFKKQLNHFPKARYLFSEIKKEKFVIEIGGKGKGKEQFKGI